MKDDAIEHMIRRHGLPPKITALIDAITKAGIDISVTSDEDRREIQQVMQFVDGPKLIAGLLGSFLSQMQVEADNAEHEEQEVDDDNDRPFIPPSFMEDEDTAVDGGDAAALMADGEGAAGAAPAAPEPTDESGNAEPDAAARARVDGSAFDHDGDGKVGGSKPKPVKSPRKKAAAKK